MKGHGDPCDQELFGYHLMVLAEHISVKECRLMVVFVTLFVMYQPVIVNC